MGGKSMDTDGGLGGKEFVGSKFRLIAGVGVRMRPSAGEEVEGSAESLSELVSFDDEVLSTDSVKRLRATSPKIRSTQTLARLGRIRWERNVRRFRFVN
jgi:hypothetical protein